jgi:hypothetical protein
MHVIAYTRSITVAKIILFAKQNFEGDSTVVLTKSDPGLRGTGVNNDVSSIIVIEGAWNLYLHPDYAGTNWVVSNTGGPNGDGTYPTYEDWNGKNNAISSVQLAP